jgi:hypothetical protein
MHALLNAEKLLVSPMLLSVMFKLLCDLLSVFLLLVLSKSASQNANGAPKTGKK